MSENGLELWSDPVTVTNGKIFREVLGMNGNVEEGKTC